MPSCGCSRFTKYGTDTARGVDLAGLPASARVLANLQIEAKAEFQPVNLLMKGTSFFSDGQW